MPSYFLVASRGYMATAWLTQAMNRLPNTLAVHDGKPVTVNLNLPLSRQLAYLHSVKPGARCGLVHSVYAASLFSAYRTGDLTPGAARTAQLCRNPIMLAESMAAISARDWATDPKFREWSGPMRKAITTDRLYHATVEWPASVKAAILVEDEHAIARLTGIFTRTLLEAADLVFFAGIQKFVESRGNRPQERHPIFRHEDYTADIEAFGALVNHLAGEEMNANDLDAAFITSASNRHRRSGITDPGEVYRNWTDAERDLFNTIMLVSGLPEFYKQLGLYTFGLEWRGAVPEHSIPPKLSVNAQGLNVPAIMWIQAQNATG